MFCLRIELRAIRVEGLSLYQTKALLTNIFVLLACYLVLAYPLPFVAYNPLYCLACSTSTTSNQLKKLSAFLFLSGFWDQILTMRSLLFHHLHITGTIIDEFACWKKRCHDTSSSEWSAELWNRNIDQVVWYQSSMGPLN